MPALRPANTAPRDQARQAILDAAERLLIQVGYAQITTRKLAEEAGVNHGLVHYYFGSMEEVFFQVVERFTERSVERQRAMYATPLPFIQKWRTAMGYLEIEDRQGGYSKVLFELIALSWNHPELKERMANVLDQWRGVLNNAFSQALEEYGLEGGIGPFSLEALVALVMTFNMGYQVEQLSGIHKGHAELLASIDRFLVSLEQSKPQGKARPEGKGRPSKKSG